MQKYDVFFYEAFEEEQAALRACLPAVINAGYTWKTTQEYGLPRPAAPCISIRTQSTLPESWAGHLQAILSRSTGYDHLLRFRDRATPPPACGHLPLYCHRAVAEQALMMWMALLRRLPRQLRQFRTFDRDGLTGREARDRTLLVVGVGNIGHEVVMIGKGLGMHTLGVDIRRKHPDVDYADISQAIGQADVIVCAMNLTDDNRGYFDGARLKAAKPGAIFINIA
ncbi:MAG: hydroxyacid dehydrogenase, partial [Lentisphaerae bacterium]|nr:hydroxyacid dehydrogenase [Lentisphaerota bacterium]